MHVSSDVARLATRLTVRPLFSPRLPLAVRRVLTDATGLAVPGPRGTRRRHVELGGVPTVRVVAPGAVGPHQVVHLHGGGYVLGSARSHGGLVARLSESTAAPVHVPAYRLAPEHRHPAALDDALAAYRALRATGHAAQRIAVTGDSAGGGLAMSLVLRLREEGEELPGSIGLISPWLDLDLRSPTIAANASTDALLSSSWLPAAARDYSGDQRPPELRPLDADLTGLPPIHVLAATGEILLGDADELVERLAKAGAPHTYNRVDGMWHDFVLYAGLMREADDALSALAAHLRSDTAS